MEAPLDEQFNVTPTTAEVSRSTKSPAEKVQSTSAIATATREAETKKTLEPATATEVATSPKPTGAPKSASARLAARRQATLKAQQRVGATLITPEHFGYVRRDLITIAVLAFIMFIAIIVLYYVLI